jgi:AraC family transcriptional regulator
MRTKLAAALVLFCLAAFAQVSKVPGWLLSGMNRQAFTIDVDRTVHYTGHASATIRCAQKHCSDFGTLMQTFKAAKYLGRRVRLSAWVKAERAGRASIWMRVDGVDSQLAFDNMQRRAAHGTFDWRQQQIVLDVPDDAATINYGLILESHGQAWVDDFAFEIVDRHVKSTNMLPQPFLTGRVMTGQRFLALPDDAVNLNFEE